jgi:hypothetical protein
VVLSRLIYSRAVHVDEPSQAGIPAIAGEGFSRGEIDALRELCVTAFPESCCRVEIMAGFEIIHEQLKALAYAATCGSMAVF